MFALMVLPSPSMPLHFEEEQDGKEGEKQDNEEAEPKRAEVEKEEEDDDVVPPLLDLFLVCTI